MKKETRITISGTDLVFYLLANEIGKERLEELKNKTEGITIRWDIKETGDHDRGTYFRDLREVVITLSE